MKLEIWRMYQLKMDQLHPEDENTLYKLKNIKYQGFVKKHPLIGLAGDTVQLLEIHYKLCAVYDGEKRYYTRTSNLGEKMNLSSIPPVTINTKILVTREQYDELKKAIVNRSDISGCSRFDELDLSGYWIIESMKITSSYLPSGKLNVSVVLRESVMPEEKPPIGLIPQRIWERKRFSEVSSAISRYHENGLEIDLKWVAEYNAHIRKMKKLKKP